MTEASVRFAAGQSFQTKYGGMPELLVRAPGRVNLIGEHTDYNDGFVLPLAIDRGVWIALRTIDAPRVIVYSQEFDEERQFDLSDDTPGDGGWLEYMRGIAWALREAGYALRGWQGATAGDVPMGAGLSSSAAVEMATARAFAAVSGFAWNARAMARVAQRAENDWVGVNCGIMDQMISAAGRAGHALLIDCRSLDVRPVALPPQTAVVIMDTATRRGLVDSAYNERRHSCETAARLLQVPALRDVDMATFEQRAGNMDGTVRKRARHVISENERTLAAAAALEAGNAAEAGRLMNASHTSLRDDFEVSRPELDRIVEVAQAQSGCYGARMTGAGFGGCAVALVAAAEAADFAERVSDAYTAATTLQPKIYVCSAADGASIIADASS